MTLVFRLVTNWLPSNTMAPTFPSKDLIAVMPISTDRGFYQKGLTSTNRMAPNLNHDWTNVPFQ